MRTLLMAACAAAAMAGSTVAVHADWQVSTYTDAMTDRTETAATLAATTGQATLRVTCARGRAVAEVTFPSHVGFLRIDTKYRFDEGPIVPRTASLSRDGRTLSLWGGEPAAALKRLTTAKRLRVQIFPVAAPVEFFEFTLAGADKAIGQIRCK